MPVEVTDVIDGANAAISSAGRAVSQEDAALIAGAKTGDARAFELLIQRHRVKIFLLAQRMTRNRGGRRRRRAGEPPESVHSLEDV